MERLLKVGITSKTSILTSVAASTLTPRTISVCVVCVCVCVCVGDKCLYVVQVELHGRNAKHAQLKIMPRYKVKAEGDVVSGNPSTFVVLSAV